MSLCQSKILLGQCTGQVPGFCIPKTELTCENLYYVVQMAPTRFYFASKSNPKQEINNKTDFMFRLGSGPRLGEYGNVTNSLAKVSCVCIRLM